MDSHVSSGVNLVWNLGGSWIRVKNFDFLGKFRFFSGNFTKKKSNFQRKFTKNFDFLGNFTDNFDLFQAMSQWKNRFSGQISEKFRFCSGNFTKRFDFSKQISENFDFLDNFTKISIFQAKLAIYSYFWANYSISLQKSPLSNILPVQR